MRSYLQKAQGRAPQNASYRIGCFAAQCSPFQTRLFPAATSHATAHLIFPRITMTRESLRRFQRASSIPG